MLVEKRISSKINYDVLKNLNSLGKNLGSTSEASAAPTAVESKPIIRYYSWDSLESPTSNYLFNANSFLVPNEERYSPVRQGQ